MAWSDTVVVDQERAERISHNYGMITGTCDITEYHQTKVAITDITKYFRGGVRVVCDGVSNEGYLYQWYSQATFKCYKPTYLGITADANKGDPISFSANILYATAAGTISSPATECATAEDCGAVSFTAIGRI